MYYGEKSIIKLNGSISSNWFKKNTGSSIFSDSLDPCLMNYLRTCVMILISILKLINRNSKIISSTEINLILKMGSGIHNLNRWKTQMKIIIKIIMLQLRRFKFRILIIYLKLLRSIMRVNLIIYLLLNRSKK